jgi:hypothetical protein
MNQRRWLAAAACALAVAALVGVVILSGGAGASGSTVSRGGSGWLAARRYLEARGARVTLITEPLDAYEAAQSAAAEGGNDGPDVLALVFPWQERTPADLRATLDAHLSRGGDLVVAYSGEPDGAEESLDFLPMVEPEKAPVNPSRWYSFVHREWDLRPAASMPAGAAAHPGSAAAASWLPVHVWAPRALPVPAPGAEVLYASPSGLPVVTVFRRHGGRVVLLPADALANGRLALPGNANLLEALRQNLGRRWAFDEIHHGLVTRSSVAPQLGRTADLLSAHLVLLYLLAVATLARRQGPAWREEVALGGSPRGFLVGIGALHDRLGHHRDAARLLLRRARELDRGLQLPAELDRLAESAGPEDLLAIARRVARRRAGGPPPAAAGEVP